MKKLVIIILLVLILVLNPNITGKNTKTDSKVLQELSNKKTVKVVIDVKEKPKNLPKNKIRHNFGNKISLEVSEKELQELEFNPDVEKINLIGIKKPFLEQSVPLINASPNTWRTKINGINLTGLHETVCVLDTGVDFTHPDLQGKNKTCVIDCTAGIGNCVEDCSVGDYNGHGTHCAGIIGANGTLGGVAPDVGLIGVKVCTQGAGCADDDIKAGIDWCINNASQYNISVLSISLGSETLYNSYCDGIDDDSDLTSGINTAIANNISVIVATGNDANSTHIASPACIKNSTAVGMTYDKNYSGTICWGGGSCPGGNTCDDSNPSEDQVVCASNRNNLTDLFAPGALINSTYTSSTYYQTGGTSMATPHVAAAFALLQQFKNLEKSQTLTPSEIESTLNLTGKNINDTSESGLNYSRIDIFSAILSLDETAPSINLISPSDNSINNSENITLTCNATDSIQLENLTIKLWNSTNYLINSTSFNATSNSLTVQLNLTNLSRDTYTWNCFAYDSQGNNAYATSNYTFIRPLIHTTLESPLDNTYSNTNSTNFTCNSYSSSNSSLSNVTFYLWNSSTLIHNSTKNISGESNESNFNYTFSNQGNYTWNCKAINNQSDSNFADSNYTFIYDSIFPNITLISPANSYSSTGTTSITFQYNVSESYLENCSLIINNAIDQTNSSINQSITNSFIKSLSAGTYNWKINCTDSANNIANSSQRTITINAQSSGSSGSGGSSGGGRAVSTTYTISDSEIRQGISKKLPIGGEINFNIKNKSHELKINKILDNKVILTIQSNPINLTLKPNQIRKINFDDDLYYDFFIKLDSINFYKANITIQEIHEKIPVKKPIQENKTKTNQTKEKPEKKLEEKPEGNNFNHKIPLIIFGIILIFLVLENNSSRNWLKNIISQTKNLITNIFVNSNKS